MPATETPPSLVRISGSTFSLRVLAAAIILLFCYYAQGVVITLLLSILLAYFLDPAVELLERKLEAQWKAESAASRAACQRSAQMQQAPPMPKRARNRAWCTR